MRAFIENILSNYKLIFSASPYTIFDEEIKSNKEKEIINYSSRAILYSA